MNVRQRQKLLAFVADGFDTYLADGRVLHEVEGDNLLSRYVRDVIDRNPHLGGADPDYREVFRENMESFVSEMADVFETIDRSGETERLMYERFVNGSPGERRTLWKQVAGMAERKYSPDELNTRGYDSQLTGDNEEVVFDMFARDWNDALQQRLSAEKRERLASAAADWEKSCARTCQRDYRARRTIREASFRYPQLAEIARIIGRRHDSDREEKTRLARHYRPSALSASVTAHEIDRITTGNNLECIVPSELSWLARPETEMLFMMRYAQRQLQQFTSPGCDNSVYAPRSEVRPRPISGPIIVSVDTSSSMDGHASEIAVSMLHQLLDIARRENRQCYLITFSVHSQSVDLGKPGRWRDIERFLSGAYTGGTNGERMLRDAIRQLHSEDYRMADVLIISDFAFAPPVPATLAAIRREQMNDTKFYGLQIGRLTTPYTRILDHIWQVE
ncbi:MAG: hypothetical protein K2H98_04335 [Duncaniella sp.]|nr:hypothetical protein [Duncaniella sp.]